MTGVTAFGDVEVALDAAGNPLCPGCGINDVGRAGLLNSRSGRSCYCPPADPRIDEPQTLAAARERIHAAFEQLQAFTVDQPAACTCRPCLASDSLLWGVR